MSKQTQIKMRKNFVFTLAISLLFIGCSLDNDDQYMLDNITGGGVNQNLAGNLTSNLTLKSGVDHTLTGALIVKDGAVLTIDAGAKIKALAGGTNVYIMVEKGGKIMANGTATAPIEFTSNSTNPKAGDWGGIIINGKAPLSRKANSESNAATEVNTTIYFGGDVVDDNSGILNYVKIEYTGARIDDSAEHNGLTLNGVGSGTTLSNIAILNGDDDAIEFFGGTVNASNILVVNAKDDMFDFTQGYTGTCTNLYGIRENQFSAVTSDPRGIEADGNLDGNTPTDINQSNFTINGLSIIHNGDGVSLSDAIKVRRGATAIITNAYIATGSGATFSDVIDLTDGKGSASDHTDIEAVANVSNGLDISDNKNTTTGNATVVIISGNSGGGDNSVFSWTGYNF